LIAQLMPHRDTGIVVQRFRARPWERTMLRAWLAEIGLQTLDTPECREALLEVSGGSAVLLSKMRPGLEELVSKRRMEDTVQGIHELGVDFGILPSEIGLPESLVPVFCTAVELVEGAEGTDHASLVDLLLSEGNCDVDQQLGLMEKLGLFRRVNPENDNLISLSPFGALVFRTCDRPKFAGRS
jgi:hypothetical protein